MHVVGGTKPAIGVWTRNRFPALDEGKWEPHYFHKKRCFNGVSRD